MNAPLRPARQRALERLMRVEEEGAFVGRVAGDAGGNLPDDAREERQAAEYVGGVTRLRRWLDFLIDELYTGDADRLEPALRQVLRIGLYDLLVLDTPPHAAVHEAVELAKRSVGRRTAGLANAVLRAAERRRTDLPLPQTGDQVRDLAVAFSHPDWIVRRWLDRYGADVTVALLEHANARPVFGLRVNTLRLDVDELASRLDELGVEWERSPFLDDFLRVRHLQPVLRAGLIADGSCAVQDEAAGLVVRLLDPRPGETVVDVAAAPGGKALYAAARMGNEGRVLAFDVHAARLELLGRAAGAHGTPIIETAESDVRELPGRDDIPSADRVLLDAPCSGLGVLAKRADLRWRRRESDVLELCALQDEMLDAAARLVSPGGLLVYSTCTLEPEENESRIKAFLSRNADYTVESAEGFVPSEMVTKEGFYLALPHHHGTDGAFGARLRRGNGSLGAAGER